jgi:cell division protein FtsB
MLIGLEYVIAAYGTWMITFVVYIILTKRHLKTTSHAVTALEQQVSETSVASQNGNNP